MIKNAANICVIVILLSCFQLSAQNAHIGVRGGYSISNWSGLVFDIGQEVSNISGFHGGIYIKVNFSDAIAIEPGIQYSQQGYKLSGTIEDSDGNDVTGELESSIAYLHVPIPVKFIFSGFHIGVGPYASFLLSANDEIFVQGVSIEKADSKEFIQDVDFGLTGSVGYEFKFGLNLQASYDLGLYNVVAIEGYNSWSDAKNRVLKFSVGYTIGGS